jgi:hypothetical protein
MNKSRRMRWAAYAAHMGKRIIAYHRPPGRSRRRWEDNIKIILDKQNV